MAWHSESRSALARSALAAKQVSATTDSDQHERPSSVAPRPFIPQSRFPRDSFDHPNHFHESRRFELKKFWPHCTDFRRHSRENHLRPNNSMDICDEDRCRTPPCYAINSPYRFSKILAPIRETRISRPVDRTENSVQSNDPDQPPTFCAFVTLQHPWNG